MTVTRSSLLRRVRNPADGEGWREFYRIYEPLLMSYVRSKGLQDSDARDVVAEVLAKLYVTMPEFELDHGRGRFRTWLWRLTMNALVDLKRRHRPAEPWTDKLDLPDETREPDALWNDEYLRRILQVVVEQVRQQTSARHPKTWACFEKHILGNRPAADVGAELGLSANAVYVHASRVQKRVRELSLLKYEEELGHESR